MARAYLGPPRRPCAIGVVQNHDRLDLPAHHLGTIDDGRPRRTRPFTDGLVDHLITAALFYRTLRVGRARNLGSCIVESYVDVVRVWGVVQAGPQLHLAEAHDRRDWQKTRKLPPAPHRGTDRRGSGGICHQAPLVASGATTVFGPTHAVVRTPCPARGVVRETLPPTPCRIMSRRVKDGGSQVLRSPGGKVCGRERGDTCAFATPPGAGSANGLSKPRRELGSQLPFRVGLGGPP